MVLIYLSGLLLNELSGVFFTVYKVSKYCVNVYMFIFMSRHVCRAGVAAGLTSSYR